MATLYIRSFNVKDSLSDEEVAAYWGFLLDELGPAVQKVDGVQSVKWSSGSGALRADLVVAVEMDNAGVYERCLVDATVRTMLGRFYGEMDLKSSKQSFRREVTPALIRALSSQG